MKTILHTSLILLSLIVLSTQTVVSQNTTFKLTDYKTPVYNYQALDLNFDLTSLFSASQNSNSTQSSGHNYSVNSDLKAAYTGFVNSAGQQREISVSFRQSIMAEGHHVNEPYDQVNTYNLFLPSEHLTITGLQRFYNAKQNYIEINATLLNNLMHYTDKHKTLSSGPAAYSVESTVKQYVSQSNGAILLGKGRIEQVQDARLALYLLDDLNKLNRDKRPASDQDVLALAKLITSLKYKRFFDDRLRKIAEITAIDSFMRVNRLTGLTDAVYYTSLSDNWNFANNPVRLSGRRLFAGIEGELLYANAKDNSTNKETNESIYSTKRKQGDVGLYAVAGIDFEKPVSLRWQQSANFKAGIGSTYQFRTYSEETTPADSSEYYGGTPSIKLAAAYGCGYYPNSRTWFTVNWDITALYEKQNKGTIKKDQTFFQDKFTCYSGPKVQAYFYLSQKLRLNLSFQGWFRFTNDKSSYTYAQQEPATKNTIFDWNQQVNAGLIYSLF